MEGIYHVERGVDEEQGHDVRSLSGRVEETPGGTCLGAVGRRSEKELI